MSLGKLEFYLKPVFIVTRWWDYREVANSYQLRLQEQLQMSSGKNPIIFLIKLV